MADIAAAMKDGYGSEAKNISHGTHVAGIFVGNSKRPAINGLLLEGAAPNAQVLLMRIPDKLIRTNLVKHMLKQSQTLLI